MYTKVNNDCLHFFPDYYLRKRNMYHQRKRTLKIDMEMVIIINYEQNKYNYRSLKKSKSDYI